MNMWEDMKNLPQDERMEMAMKHFMDTRNHAYLQHRFPSYDVVATASSGPWDTTRIAQEGFYAARLVNCKDQLNYPIKQIDFLEMMANTLYMANIAPQTFAP